MVIVTVQMTNNFDSFALLSIGQCCGDSTMQMLNNLNCFALSPGKRQNTK